MMMTPRSTSKGTRLVLAVDDEEDHLLAYEVAFGREPDLRLITATNTRAAGIALRAHSVDAMLLNLFDSRGWDHPLSAHQGPSLRFHSLPVIALSALPAEDMPHPACSRLLRFPAEALQPRANRRGCALLS